MSEFEYNTVNINEFKHTLEQRFMLYSCCYLSMCVYALNKTEQAFSFNDCTAAYPSPVFFTSLDYLFLI
jgi:hypothetical protein